MPRMTLDDIDVMVRLRERGESLSAIRRCVRWSETTISLVLHRLAHGVSPEQVTERPGWGGPRRRINHVASPTLPVLRGALCAGDPDPDLWFRAEDEVLAVAACRRCRVSDQCRSWALEAGVRDGVWGGLTEQQLRRLVDDQTPDAHDAQPAEPAHATVPPHGTVARHRRGCRCQPCKDAATSYRAENRAARREKPVPDGQHGTVNSYTTYACRCEPCRAAYSAYRQAWRARTGRGVTA